MNTNTRILTLSAAALSATFLLSACDMPDLQARYDKSEEHTISRGGRR